MAYTDEKWFVILDGQEQGQYESHSFVFSPDSKRVAYVALVPERRWGFIKVGESHMIVVDGQEGSQYDDIVAPRESGGIIFDSPNQLHYMAQRGNAFYLVEERLT